MVLGTSHLRPWSRQGQPVSDNVKYSIYGLHAASSYVSASSWNYICHFFLATDDPTEFHPWRSNQNRLSADGVDVLVFHPSQETGPDPSAHYKCVRLEWRQTAFEDLRNVLERAANYGTPFGEEPSQGIRQIRWGIDADGGIGGR